MKISVALLIAVLAITPVAAAEREDAPTMTQPRSPVLVQPQAVKPRVRAQAPAFGTPPPGLSWHVIQPTDFREERMYHYDTSTLHLFHIYSGPVIRLTRHDANMLYSAMAPVRLPDGVSIQWLECYIVDQQGSGDTSIRATLHQHWLVEPTRNDTVASVRIYAPGEINDKIYRGFAAPQNPHRVDNANTYYVLRATFGSKTGRGQGLRACKIGYSNT